MAFHNAGCKLNLGIGLKERIVGGTDHGVGHCMSHLIISTPLVEKVF